MIQPLKIISSSLGRKRLIKGMFRYRNSVMFENPLVTGLPPEGYMTSEEFWKKSRESIDNICRKHGIL